MNWIDLLLVVVVLGSVWASVQRGFIISLLELLAWVGSLVIGFMALGYAAAKAYSIAGYMGVAFSFYYPRNAFQVYPYRVG
jgi:uncharacterized membrane protein required for colicin V production